MRRDAAAVDDTIPGYPAQWMFSLAVVDYLHRRIAAPGCSAARVERA